MFNHTGMPQGIRRINLKAVREAFMEKGTATRGEIAAAAKISVTTARTILGEMLLNNEIAAVGAGESLGGRRAERYAWNKDRFLGVVIGLGEQEIRYATINSIGERKESGRAHMGCDPMESIFACLDGLFSKMEFSAIGVGVPGIVCGMSYLSKNADGVLTTHPIGEILYGRYGVPVVLENDLNAITLGFGRCYQNEFPEVKSENVNMAYISFEAGCLSAGFLSGGQILRGWNNFVGELGLYPMKDEQTLDDVFAASLSNAQYAALTARIIAGICCILNPQYVALGGSRLRKACLPLIMESFSGLLPDKMSAEILDAGDKWHDYLAGLAYLTVQQMFAHRA